LNEKQNKDIDVAIWCDNMFICLLFLTQIVNYWFSS